MAQVVYQDRVYARKQALALFLIPSDLSSELIAERCGVNVDTVRRWYKAWGVGKRDVKFRPRYIVRNC